MKLTSENVNEVFIKCLFKEGENTDKHVIGKAVKMTVGFNPVRLNEAKDDIVSMLDSLSDSFKADSGGMSFLNMCEDMDGNLWTGLHEIMDELVALGTATEKLEFTLPRKMWSIMPGSMPYLVVKK